MSSLHRQRGRSPFWDRAYRTADGKQHFKSTGTTSKAEALILCQKMASGAKLARRRRLNPDIARRIIEAAVAEMLEEAGQVLPHSTIRAFLTSWLNEKRNAGAETTFVRYEGIIQKFLAYLGPRAEDSLASLSKPDILSFRDDLAGTVTPGTVNTYLKVLRVALGRAVKEQIIEKNPAALVDTLKHRDRHQRRAFSMEELRRLLALASQDWQTMILVGLYTGLRMQDIANLTWANLDLAKQEIVTATRKTDRTQLLPLALPLARYLETLPTGDNPTQPLCPNLRGKSSSWLSNQFYDLMAAAGLVEARDHQGRGRGRGRRRTLNAISFHALRHTATSLLKNAGVSGPIAQDIIGHESEAISRNYTHIDMATKREAVDKMPDVFSPEAS